MKTIIAFALVSQMSGQNAAIGSYSIIVGNNNSASGRCSVIVGHGISDNGEDNYINIENKIIIAAATPADRSRLWPLIEQKAREVLNGMGYDIQGTLTLENPSGCMRDH